MKMYSFCCLPTRFLVGLVFILPLGGKFNKGGKIYV